MAAGTGSVSAEREVKVSASEAWKLYGTLLVDQVLKKRHPQAFDKIDIISGDGGVGTIVHVFLHPELPSLVRSFKEKFTVVDNEKRVKVAEVVDGGYLDLGFIFYRTRVEVIEKEGKEDECTTRVTIEYELKEEAAANASLVSIDAFASCLEVIADYLHENNNNNNNNSKSN